MCGIAGYAGLHQPELLEPMCQALAHRGPDDQGIWFDAEAGVGLGQRRLSIIDPSPAGHQPMSNPERTVWLSYNGELYDFKKQRAILESEGVGFRSQSDSEVLIALYQKHGLDFLSQLNGMFAFALWDAKRKRLILARDHAGIKPLYYYRNGPKLYFASELKALLTIPGLRREMHLPSLRDYLHFLYVPGEQTLLRDFKKVEPGHCLIWHSGEIETRRWFTLRYEAEPSMSERDWVAQVHDSFMASVERHMISDQPVGAFLSGGLDSSSIVAAMRQAHPDRQINAYTVKFKSGDIAHEQGEDDYPYAKKVAQSLNLRLKTVELNADVMRLLPKMVYQLDEPNADPAVFPTYLMAKQAREDGMRVLLSGTGADEIFFGYRSHQAYQYYNKLAWLARFPTSRILSSLTTLSRGLLGAHNRHVRRLHKFNQGLSESGLQRHLALADWSSPALRERLLNPALHQAAKLGEIPDSMHKYNEAFEGSGELNRHSHLLIQSFLAAHNFLYSDKASMAASVEVRVPFMDVELMKLCAGIPENAKLQGHSTKALLKKAMAPYLPREILHRQKTGFGVPLHTWMRSSLAPMIDELLSPSHIEKRGLFRGEAIEDLLHENKTGRANHSYLIYALLNLEIWQQTFLDKPGVQI